MEPPRNMKKGHRAAAAGDEEVVAEISWENFFDGSTSLMMGDATDSAICSPKYHYSITLWMESQRTHNTTTLYIYFY